MKVSFDKIKKALYGAVYYVQDETALKPCRFTEKQIQTFIETDIGICKPLKSGASSSMKLDFYTDSNTLKLMVNCFTGSSRECCYIDVLVDGELIAHQGYSEYTEKSFDVVTSLPEGRRQITIYLPNLFGTDILGLELDEGAEFTPVPKDIKVLFCGDSITQGYTAEYPSLSYVNLFSQHFNAEIVNQGIGGARFDFTDLDEDLPFNPQKVIIAYGTNDWSKGVDFESKAIEYFTKLKSIYKTAEIYAILPIWRGDTSVKEQTTKCTFTKMHKLLQQAIESVGGIKIIDGTKLVPHDAKLFMPDTLHPIEAGFKHYAKNLIEILENEK